MSAYVCTECGEEVDDEVSLDARQGYCWNCMKPVILANEEEFDFNDPIVRREETTR